MLLDALEILLRQFQVIVEEREHPPEKSREETVKDVIEVHLIAAVVAAKVAVQLDEDLRVGLEERAIAAVEEVVEVALRAIE